MKGSNLIDKRLDNTSKSSKTIITNPILLTNQKNIYKEERHLNKDNTE